MKCFSLIIMLALLSSFSPAIQDKTSSYLPNDLKPWWNTPDTLVWSNLPNNLVGCISTAGVYLSGKFYQICGYLNLGQDYLHAQIFDGVSWSQSTVCHPQGVHSHSVTAWNNKIIISGGSNYYGYYDYTTIYDPSVPIWQVSTPMPLPPAYLTAMSEFNGRCYLFGGRTQPGLILSSTYSWIPGDSSMFQKVNMPLPRYGMCAAKWNNKIYVFGGNITATTVGNNIWEYNPTQNTWTIKNSTMMISRSQACAITIGDKIYIIGGNTPSPTNSVEIYNPVNDTISVGPSLLFATAGEAAGGCIVPSANTVYTGKIYVSGGSGYLTNACLGTVSGVICNQVVPTSLGNLKALYHQ